MHNRIHASAIVEAGARLGSDVTIGPYAVVEAGAEIGDGSTVAAHAVVKRHARLGRRVHVGEHAVIGGDPQDLKFADCTSFVTIGDDTVIREGVTIHRGSREGAATRIGRRCLLMGGVHVAHDCELADGVIVANATAFSGHVRVGERAFVSGLVGVHQFCRIGRLAMVGGAARISQDCLPFVITEGHPGRARGLNVVGLRRAGFDSAALLELKRAFRLLRSGQPLAHILAQLDALASPAAREMAEFIRTSERGFAHPVRACTAAGRTGTDHAQD